jgi:phage anti-repressor protein
MTADRLQDSAFNARRHNRPLKQSISCIRINRYSHANIMNDRTPEQILLEELRAISAESTRNIAILEVKTEQTRQLVQDFIQSAKPRKDNAS